MSQAKSGNYIKFLPEDRDVLVSHKDATVLDVALRAGIPLDHTCGGHGTCGTCLVNVLSGLADLGSREEIEQEMANDRHFSNHERLACQIAPAAGLVVQIRSSKN